MDFTPIIKCGYRNDKIIHNSKSKDYAKKFYMKEYFYEFDE